MAARMIAETRPEPEAELGIWPENWHAVRGFLALATQWRIGAMSGLPTGLDYGVVPTTLRLLRIRPTPDIFDRLRIMEGAALEVFADQVRH